MIHVLDHLLDPRGFMQALRAAGARPSCRGAHRHPQRGVALGAHAGRALAGLRSAAAPAALQSASSIGAARARAASRSSSSRRTTNHFPLLTSSSMGSWAFGSARPPFRAGPLPVLPLKLGNMATICGPEASRGMRKSCKDFIAGLEKHSAALLQLRPGPGGEYHPGRCGLELQGRPPPRAHPPTGGRRARAHRGGPHRVASTSRRCSGSPCR